MNPSTFDITLANSLGDSISAPGVDGQYYTAQQRATAGMRATREFSRYRPLLRRVGTGELYAVAPIAATSIQIAAGWFNPGDVITIDQYSVWSTSETVTVESIQKIIPSVTGVSTSYANDIIQLNVTPALQFNHAMGASVQIATPGISIVTGKDQYPLGLDFFRPDQQSFQQAIGIPMAFQQNQGYYDAAYMKANTFADMGYGQSTNFTGTNSGGWPISGNIFDNPNGAPRSTMQDACWRFMQTDEPYLLVMPSPVGDSFLAFSYFGCQTISSLPTVDVDPVLDYSLYVLFLARAATINEGEGFGDAHDKDFGQSPSSNAEKLRQMAKDAYKRYDLTVRSIPIFVSG